MANRNRKSHSYSAFRSRTDLHLWACGLVESMTFTFVVYLLISYLINR